MRGRAVLGLAVPSLPVLRPPVCGREVFVPLYPVVLNGLDVLLSGLEVVGWLARRVEAVLRVPVVYDVDARLFAAIMILAQVYLL